MRQYGEYRTRRLVLDAWDRLEGVDVGNPQSSPTQSAAVQPQPATRPAPVKPPQKEVELPEAQPTFSDFGLYKCQVCGKMVMGFEKANHEREKHGGKRVEWKKVR